MGFLHTICFDAHYIVSFVTDIYYGLYFSQDQKKQDINY